LDIVQEKTEIGGEKIIKLINKNQDREPPPLDFLRRRERGRENDSKK
jgi:hypothetical protein